MKKPSRFLYVFAACLLIPYLKIKFRVIRARKPDLEQPSVVLGNHQAVHDPLFLAYAFYPYRLNFVGGYELLLNSKTKWIAKRFHVIPKFQYQIDLKAIKQMRQVIQHNGTLALFPTGRLSSAGQGFETTLALIKLLKKLYVPVYFCTIEGAYFSSPKWAKKKRKGRVHVSYELLFSKEDLQTKEETSLFDEVNQRLNHNEYLYQERHPTPFKGKDLAEHLEKILYHCPHCHQEYHLHSKGNQFRCTHCGSTWELDAFGYFKDNPYFPHPLAWFHEQETRVLAQIKSGNYALSSSVIVKSARNQRMSVLGKGIVKLEHGFLRFEGTLQQMQTSFEIPLNQLVSLPYRAGVNIEVAHNEKIYLFELEQGLSAVQWSISVEQWHRFLC